MLILQMKAKYFDTEQDCRRALRFHLASACANDCDCGSKFGFDQCRIDFRYRLPDCPAGQYGSVGAATAAEAWCKNCPSGWYQSAKDQSACSICAEGTNSAPGALACTPPPTRAPTPPSRLAPRTRGRQA